MNRCRNCRWYNDISERCITFGQQKPDDGCDFDFTEKEDDDAESTIDSD